MTRDELAALLPAIHRSRDEERGHPLRALLRIIEEQVRVIEDDLDTWYANWFVETCDEWIVPYIAALVGIDREGVSRAEVADAVAVRRRKGTAAALEQLAFDVAGRPARAVETYRMLVRDQHLRHLRPDRPATFDVRDLVACERVGGPFDTAPRLPDVRRINSELTRGLPNIPSLALYVWRLLSFPVTRAPAFCVDQRYSRYLVNVLGIDTQLFAPQGTGPKAAHLSGPADLPQPIGHEEFAAAVTEYYGPGRALRIWRDSLDNPVPASRIVGADLSDWRYRPQPGQVVVDPVLGRIAFPPDEAPEEGVWVSWCYGFSERMGGGAYARATAPVGERRRYVVGGDGFGSITAALRQWQEDKEADPALHDALVEIVDSADYTEALCVELDLDDRLELRAAPYQRPVIRLLNQRANRFDALSVRARSKTPPPGGAADCPPPSARRPRLLLDGLVISGRSVDITGQVGEVTIRHCTLVPGWELDDRCEPRHGEEPSIELRRTTARLRVERSIVGTILVDQDETAGEPLIVEAYDSIIDATGRELAAVTGVDARNAYADLTLRRCTVLGQVRVHLLRLAEDSIVTGCVHVARRDAGCARHSYVSYACHGGPPRYRCPPDSDNRLRPRFTSVRYGTPGYCRLHETCADAIRTGAEDGAEMGAFHDLFEARRLANLVDHLDGFVPLGVDAAVINAT
ncbi:phage tail protein [Nonomuraea sp. NPDC052116]|uniref:phage tail protein n=1 Tax=Nonomuraea sp. NPDC052116 TaxID=3155665 RepID=UPI003421597A